MNNRRRYWLLYFSLDTLDDFGLAKSLGNEITEADLNANNNSPHRIKVMELSHRQYKKFKCDPTNTPVFAC